MMKRDTICSASEVRSKWSDALNEAEEGGIITVTRPHHEPVSLVGRAALQNLMRRNEELEELVEVYELMADEDVRKSIRVAESQIERGEGLSFEDVFGEELQVALGKGYKAVIAPIVAGQLDRLGIKDGAREAIRDAMADPGRAGKQLTGDFFPYRRLKFSRYRIIYKFVKPESPASAEAHEAGEVHFVWAGIRKEGDKKDVHKVFEKMMNRGEVD